ncbi:MAG: hypothetical protein WCT14_06320 [Treponemataceae bacterium]
MKSLVYRLKSVLFFVVIVASSISVAFAGGARQVDSTSEKTSSELPVTRIALFSSGVGYFEHSGQLSGDAAINLPFRTDEVNDALKSLVVYPGEGGLSPAVSYPSKADSERALKAFAVDLSGRPRVMDLLARMRGAELDVRYEESRRYIGRILSVENTGHPVVALLGAEGVRSIPMEKIESFRFTDSALDADFNRALSLIGRERDASRTALELRLPGVGERKTSFGYVVAAPVWKATYRLDMSAKVPFLQGWAVVDNATDRDWRNISLSLVSGRPVSFIQDLYAPVYLQRPVVPLSIVGTAAPRTYSSGVGGMEADMQPEASSEYADAEASPSRKESFAPPSPSSVAKSLSSAPREKKRGGAGPSADTLSSSVFEAAQGRSAGDQFEFTIARPVTLDRGRSALLPLIAGEIRSTRVSVYTAGGGSAVLGARLENSTGMKLPAGPITVFDDGVYAGDALLEFFPEKDTRLIAFGEDLSLTVEESASTSLETIGVSIAKGVMIFTRRRSASKTYTFKNAAMRDKKLVVEHPESSGSELYSPTEFMEKADGRYRFTAEVGAGKQTSLTVVERSPARETVALSSLNSDAFLRYSSSKEIPDSVKAALTEAAALRRKADDAARTLKDLQTKKTELTADQSRIRDNLFSLGRDSAEGKKYLQRLLDAEAEMDRLVDRIESSRKATQETQSLYVAYIGGLTL